jgi:hypothetical protein
VSEKPFWELLDELGERDAFLARYPRPALLLEPFEEGSGMFHTTRFSSPEGGDPYDKKKTDRFSLKEIQRILAEHSSDSRRVHLDARVKWLVKEGSGVFAGFVLTVGRTQNNDVVIKHPTISKLHAVFHLREGKWLIEDKGSSNGTFLGDDELVPDRKYEVSDGARIRLGGGVVARFFEPLSLWQFCAEQAAPS